MGRAANKSKELASQFDSLFGKTRGRDAKDHTRQDICDAVLGHHIILYNKLFSEGRLTGEVMFDDDNPSLIRYLRFTQGSDKSFAGVYCLKDDIPTSVVESNKAEFIAYNVRLFSSSLELTQTLSCAQQMRPLISKLFDDETLYSYAVGHALLSGDIPGHRESTRRYSHLTLDTVAMWQTLSNIIDEGGLIESPNLYSKGSQEINWLLDAQFLQSQTDSQSNNYLAITSDGRKLFDQSRRLGHYKAV